MCNSCAAGSFGNASGAAACALCDAGKYNPLAGSNTTASCAFCPAGKWSFTGAPSCTACLAGSYNPNVGSTSNTACVPCAAGTYNAILGGASTSACVACAAGTYNTNTGSTFSGSCVPCTAGTANPLMGGSTSEACVACSAGKFSGSGALSCRNCAAGSFSGSGAPSCSICPIGTYCASGVALDCPAGTYGLAPGFTTPANCTPCRAGTFNPLTGSTSSAACARCDYGSFASSFGASFCTLCPLGFTTLGTGAALNSSCTPCAAGTYQTTEGTPCVPCPLNTFSVTAGSTSLSNCLSCPDNGSTDVPGAPSLSSCKAFKCGPGLQPRTAAPKSSVDCTPITCPPPLSLSSDSSGCAGCGQGFFGTPPSCAACPLNSSCPGYFTTALLAFPETLALGAPASRCVSVSTLPRATVTIPNQPASFTLASLPPFVTLCIAVSLAGIVIAVYAYVARSPTQAHLRLERLLLKVDSFSMDHDVPTGNSPVNTPSALGGACTLLSWVAFLCLSTVFVLQYAYANVSVQTALTTLLSANPFSRSGRFAAPVVASPLAPSLRSGVQVRILAQEGAGCSVLAEGSFTSGSHSDWVLAPPTDCGDGRTLLTLSCPVCSFSAVSVLKFYLPYTCQSFFMEALGVDSLGVVNSVVFPPSSSAATQTTLLSSLSWTVQVLGTILEDKIRGEVIQGYQLFATAAESTAIPAGASVIPSLASVAVTIALPFQPTYSSTTLTPRLTIVDLLTSIVGLLGVLGVFRMLFMQSETLKTLLAARKRRQSALPLTSSGDSGLREAPPKQALSSATNQLHRIATSSAPSSDPPLIRAAAEVWRRDGDDGALVISSTRVVAWELPAGVQLSEAATAEAAPAPAVRELWRRDTDGSATWFVNSETGATVWTLPAGAVLAS